MLEAALMSKNSPGQGPSPWSASLSPDDLPLESFFRSGVSSIPVALVPSSGGFIRLNNPQAVQAELQAMTRHFQMISDVRQFGRGGIVCRSSDPTCVADLLKSKIFASVPVSAFIPPHLACTKGIVRGVDSRLSPTETLEKLSDAGVIAVYRCNRLVNGEKVATESVIATFAGMSCPSELKVWPLIFRVDPLPSRPLQCRNCWRFGHSAGGCKSNARCRVCGEDHSPNECTAETETCCLCGGNHAADYANCSAKANEVQVLEVIDRRRCSRQEAIAVVKDRAFGYAGVTARQSTLNEDNLSKLIESAVEKAMTKAMQHIVQTVTECISQVFTAQMTQLLQTAATPITKSLACAAEQVANSVLAPNTRSDPTFVGSDPCSSRQTDSQDDMETGHDTRPHKRTGSPVTASCPYSKNKKGNPISHSGIQESTLRR